MFDTTRRLGLWLAGAIALMLIASPALAVPQYVPTGTDLLHTIASGQPGVAYNTAAAGDQISFTQSTQLLEFQAAVDVLNYYDTANPSCATDAGSNCALNFSPDLVLQAQALLSSIVATPVGGTFVQVDIQFGTTGGTDITWTDPADGGSTQLAASWQAGTFMGTATTGLVATTFYDTSTSTVVGAVTAAGFAVLDNGTAYASLFGSDPSNRIQLQVQGIAGVDFDALITAALTTGLPDFTAEVDGEGQIFRVASGDFVIPEPSTALLLGLGLAGMALAGGGKKR